MRRLAAAVTILVTAACGRGSPSKAPVAPTTGAVSSTTAAVPPRPTTPPSQVFAGEVGSPIRTPYIELEVTSLTYSTCAGTWAPAEPGHSYLTVHFTIRNVAEPDQIPLGALDWTLIYADGSETSGAIVTCHSNGESPPSIGQASAGQVDFDVPGDAALDRLQLLPGRGDRIYINIKGR